MSDPYYGAERRTSDPILAAWNERMSVLHADIAEMKSALLWLVLPMLFWRLCW